MDSEHLGRKITILLHWLMFQEELFHKHLRASNDQELFQWFRWSLMTQKQDRERIKLRRSNINVPHINQQSWDG
jgi:hypothetical protein